MAGNPSVRRPLSVAKCLLTMFGARLNVHTMSGVLGQDAHSLYTGCYRRLVAQVLALTGDLAEAQDAVEEAFARAVAQPRPFARLDDPEAWLRVTALTVARRRRQRRERADRLRGLARRWRTRWVGWFGWMGRTERRRGSAQTAEPTAPAEVSAQTRPPHAGSPQADPVQPELAAPAERVTEVGPEAGSEGASAPTDPAAGSAAAAPLPAGYRVVLDALAGLSERYRETVALHHLAGLTVHEIASVTGVSTHTVHTRLQHGGPLIAAVSRDGSPTGPADGGGSPVVGPDG